jgi:anti-sigma regulatory factor (Ser/Thr protein kinase)
VGSGPADDKRPKAQTEIVIGNTIDEVRRLSRLIDEIAQKHSLPPGIVAEVQVAADEVLANIINYAYADHDPHVIRITMRVFHDAIELTFEDDGVAFDPLSVPQPDVQAPPGKRRVGGLGIHVVRKLMSQVEYSREGSHNRLVITKRFSPEGRNQ